jgi:hypothetical protein
MIINRIVVPMPDGEGQLASKSEIRGSAISL